MEEISRINYKRSDLLYEFPTETRLTVYRRLDVLEHNSQSREFLPNEEQYGNVRLSGRSGLVEVFRRADEE